MEVPQILTEDKPHEKDDIETTKTGRKGIFFRPVGNSRGRNGRVLLKSLLTQFDPGKYVSLLYIPGKRQMTERERNWRGNM